MSMLYNMILSKKRQCSLQFFFSICKCSKSRFQTKHNSNTTVVEYQYGITQNQEKFCLKVTGLKIFSLVFGMEECGDGKTHNHYTT